MTTKQQTERAITKPMELRKRLKYTKMTTAMKSVISYALDKGTLWIESADKRKKDIVIAQNKDTKPTTDRSELFKLVYYKPTSTILRLFISQLISFDKTHNYVDFCAMVFNLASEGRTLYIENVYAGDIRCTVEEQRTLEKGASEQFDINAAIQMIYNPPIGYTPKNVDDFARVHELISFAPVAAHIMSNNIFTEHIRAKGEFNYAKNIESLTLINAYKTVTLPRALEIKFSKFTKFFEELKNMLKFDPTSGFYTYTQDGVTLPIICQHEYMILSGKPLADVSMLCYCDGNCKYCGAEMNAYHETTKNQLPTRAYELIFKFIKAVNAGVDETGLLFTLHNNAFDMVRRYVDSANPDNYTTAVCAFVGLYFFYVYSRVCGKIKFVTDRFNKFMDAAKRYWTDIGWNQDVIEGAFKSDMFTKLNDKFLIEMIQSYIQPTDITNVDCFPLSILFESLIHPIKDVPNLKATNKLQELFLASKIPDYNKALLSKINTLWVPHESIEVIKKLKPITFTTSIPFINIEKGTQGEKFFKFCSSVWCPETTSVHVWHGVVCSKCGLKQDRSNEKDIYQKYEATIENGYLQKPIVLDAKRLNIVPVHDVKEVDKYKPEELFDKYLKVESYVIRQAIEKQLKEEHNYAKLIDLMSTITHVDMSGLPRNVNTLKRCISFIIDQKIMSPKTMLTELKHCFFKIDSIDWLLFK